MISSRQGDTFCLRTCTAIEVHCCYVAATEAIEGYPNNYIPSANSILVGVRSDFKHSKIVKRKETMDFTKLLQLGASVIQQNSDQSTTGLGTDQLASALGNLLGGAGGNPDLGALLSKMQAGGLGNIVASWLGKGENAAVSPDALYRVTWL